jgi:hypothetical protein
VALLAIPVEFWTLLLLSCLVVLIGILVIGGLFVLEQHLTAANYLQFPINELLFLMEDMPLDAGLRMFFPLGETPPHFGCQVIACLNQCYRKLWIGHDGHYVVRIFRHNSTWLIFMESYEINFIRDQSIERSGAFGSNCECFSFHTRKPHAAMGNKLIFEQLRCILLNIPIN